MKSVNESWEKFLNPQSLKQNLIAASVFLAAYEMLKQALIDQLRGFYSDSVKSLRADGEWEISETYRKKVLSLDKKETVACAIWFKNSGVLNDDDLLIIKEIADHRNIVAHELPKIIASEKEISLVHLRCVHGITSKIDNWWIREVEIPTNPDCDQREFTEEELAGCSSMRMVIMGLLIQIAEGDDSKMAWLYEEWRNQMAKKSEAEKAADSAES